MTDSVDAKTIIRVQSLTKPDVKHMTSLRSCTCEHRTYNKGANTCSHSRLLKTGVDVELIENAQRGLLIDHRTRVLSLDSFCTDYVKETKGFRPGSYCHELCWDGKRLILVTSNLTTYEETITDVPDPNTWRTLVPKTQALRQPKVRYRRPNYDWGERPVIN